MSTVYSDPTRPGLTANESTTSAASWPAIIVGAVVALAATLILVALGTGIGLASVSPWGDRGPSPATFTIVTAIWLIVVQWVASLLGGYMTGRLRTKWVGVHTHEVFFRDTAHGLAAWALATLVGAWVLTAAAGNIAGLGVQAAATAATSPAAQAAGPVNPYDIDTLFRSSNGAGDGLKPDDRAEAGRILARALSPDGISSDDDAYLAREVAARTGLSQQEAEKRVADTIARAKSATDTARKAAATAAIFTALSMLIGAFIASASAALGGRLRDLHP